MHIETMTDEHAVTSGDDDDLISVRQAARDLDLSESMVRKLADGGAIPTRRILGRRTFRRGDVAQVRAQRVARAAEREAKCL